MWANIFMPSYYFISFIPLFVQSAYVKGVHESSRKKYSYTYFNDLGPVLHFCASCLMDSFFFFKWKEIFIRKLWGWLGQAESSLTGERKAEVSGPQRTSQSGLVRGRMRVPRTLCSSPNQAHPLQWMTPSIFCLWVVSKSDSNSGEGIPIILLGSFAHLLAIGSGTIIKWLQDTLKKKNKNTHSPSLLPLIKNYSYYNTHGERISPASHWRWK